MVIKKSMQAKTIWSLIINLINRIFSELIDKKRHDLKILNHHTGKNNGKHCFQLDMATSALMITKAMKSNGHVYQSESSNML